MWPHRGHMVRHRYCDSLIRCGTVSGHIVQFCPDKGQNCSKIVATGIQFLFILWATSRILSFLLLLSFYVSRIVLFLTVRNKRPIIYDYVFFSMCFVFIFVLEMQTVFCSRLKYWLDYIIPDWIIRLFYYIPLAKTFYYKDGLLAITIFLQ